jgi:hypothetical protein
MPQSSGNNRNTSKVVLQDPSDISIAMQGGPRLRKMRVVLALAFTIGSSALSASAFARGGGLGGNHITCCRGGNHSGNVSRAAHRGLFSGVPDAAMTRGGIGAATTAL